MTWKGVLDLYGVLVDEYRRGNLDLGSFTRIFNSIYASYDVGRFPVPSSRARAARAIDELFYQLDEMEEDDDRARRHILDLWKRAR
jgi:hypothetical protein